MSKRPRMDDALPVPDAVSSSASVVDLQNVVRALQSMQTTASTLRKKLHCGKARSSNVSEDSKTLSWPGYAERLRADQVDSRDRLLTENLCTMISDLLATLCDGKKVRLCILSDDEFVDVFMCLGRVTLDAAQLTCARFDTLIEKCLKNDCFRTLVMKITSLDFEQRDGTGYAGEPKWHSAPDMYRLSISADADVRISPYFAHCYRTFIFESSDLQDIVARCEEKVLKTTYVRFMDFNGVPEVLDRIVQSHPDLAAKIVIGKAYIKELESDVDALALLDQFNAFRAVNGVSFLCMDVSLLNVNCDFFKRCREMGILDLTLNEHDDEIPVEGLLDFCFGPTREGLGNAQRSVTNVASFSEELPRRMLESLKTHGAPSHRIHLSIQGFVNFVEDNAALMDEVAKYYVLQKSCDKGKEQYAARPVDGIEVVWCFIPKIDSITCTVQFV